MSGEPPLKRLRRQYTSTTLRAPTEEYFPMATAIQVATNFVAISKLPTKTYYQYDDITVSGSDAGLPKRRNYQVIDQVQAQYAQFFNPRAVYDGRKLMFSTKDIPSTPFAVRFGRGERSKTFQITIKLVGTVNASHIRNIMAGQGTGNLQPLNLLQLIVRQAPNLSHDFRADAQSFFVAEGAWNMPHGLKAHRGYFQSVRPTPDRLLINVDTTNALLYNSEVTLLSVMMAWLDLPNERDLHNLSPAMTSKLRMYLKNVVVRETLSPKGRIKSISDLVPQAGTQVFDGPEGRITVKHYLEKKYGCRVQFPRAVGVRLGKNTVIPAEFCKIMPNQVYRKKLPPSTQREFLRFSLMNPSERTGAIDEALRRNLFNYSNSDFLAESGMQVNPTRLRVGGFVINTPRIVYGNGQTVTIQPKTGKWNVVGQKFFAPRPLVAWAVVYFTKSHDDVLRFVRDLVRNMERLGMPVKKPQPRIIPGNEQNATAALETAYEKELKNFAHRFILVLLPQNAPDCRQAVKYWGDVEKGVTTQCVRSPKWETAKDQYLNNVALKINAKIGGLNSHVEGLTDLYKHSMIIGADVGHPSPGVRNRPSVTGLVASVGPDPNFMTSMTRIQQPRVEIIQDLEEMISIAFGKWRECRLKLASEISDPPPLPPPPRMLVFYRDGVSEGELEQLRETEIAKIKRAIARRMGGNNPAPRQYWPRLLFIVVGKRHHVRFFPLHGNDADKTGNCPAGLVVTEDLKMPQYDSFYLQSHSGLLGTSRPAHYIVLQNETGLTLQQIQAMTFQLCHVYASATRSVSIPAPVYYADKLCARLEFQCANGAGLSDTASEVTGNPAADFDMDYWRQTFRPSRFENSAYFL